MRSMLEASVDTACTVWDRPGRLGMAVSYDEVAPPAFVLDPTSGSRLEAQIPAPSVQKSCWLMWRLRMDPVCGFRPAGPGVRMFLR